MRLEDLEQASSLIDRVKAAAIEDHSHGMSDPECPGCIEAVRQSLNIAEQNGRDEMAAYYEDIPGVTQLRETWEQLQAKGDPETNMITITDMADGDKPEELAHRAVREALGKDPAEENMITING